MAGIAAVKAYDIGQNHLAHLDGDFLPLIVFDLCRLTLGGDANPD